MLELGMEGHRFFDLVRWHIADVELNTYLQKEQQLRTYLNGVQLNKYAMNTFLFHNPK